MDEERCVDNCAGKLIRSNHRLMASYVQLMPRMVQRRMEELESKAAETAKLEAEATAAANVGSDLQATPLVSSPTAPVVTNEAVQNPLEFNTNEVSLVGAAEVTPAAENSLDHGALPTNGFTGVHITEPAPYEPPKAVLLPENVNSSSVTQKSTEDGAGPV